MDKRGVLFVLSLFLINFVSAFNGYRFSLGEFFDRIEPTTIVLVLVFIIIFGIIFYALSRVFKDRYDEPNVTLAGVISFALSALIIYGLYRYGFDLGDLFSGFGISEDLLYILLSILLIIGALFIIIKIGIKGFFLISGALLLFLGIFTDFFYERFTAAIIGLVLLLIGIGLARVFGGAKKAGGWVKGKYNPERQRRQARAIGRGFRRITRREDPRIKLQRYEGKRAEAEKKELAERRLAELKEQERQSKGVAKRRLSELSGRDIRRSEKAEYKEEKRRQAEVRKQQKEVERAHREALREDARRQESQNAQQKLQQIENEIARLQQGLNTEVSITRRKRMESQLKDLSKMARKLGRRI
jgi:hypothetical protein